VRPPIDCYLELLARELLSLPATRRDDEVREIRAHLVDAAAKGCDAGQADDEAMLSAMEQFGAPDVVGRRIAAVWRRCERLGRLGSLCGAALTMQVLFTAEAGPGRSLTCYNPPASGVVELLCLVALFAVGLALPVLNGWVAGFAFPSRAVGGIVLAVFVGCLAATPVPGSMPAALSGGVSVDVHGLPLWLLIVASRCAVYSALALLGARAGSKRRLARANRRRGASPQASA
jgi:hypothetical protein